jgi:hypothetical protein
MEMTEMTEKNINTQELEDSLELRVAKAIATIKRTSERVVGITATEYSFLQIKYNSTTIRPVPITPLERAIGGILDIDECGTLVGIGKILGLDVIHDIAEQSMLNEAIIKMKSYGVLEGDESYLTLTPKGKIFAKEGERPETYERKFQIFYDTTHADYVYLSSDFEKSKKEIAKVDNSYLPQLDIEVIKSFAEHQAPAVQNAKNRYILQSVNFLNAESVSVRIYVAFLQSIRNEKEIRAIAYDDSQNTILPHFSELIQNDTEWFAQLLNNCIANLLDKNIEDGGWERVSISQEKDETQKAIEAEVVKLEDAETEGQTFEGYNELERLHKKSLYDQTSFELELDNIFRTDKPDEVWMISPWVKYAFVKKRVSQFEPLLKAGKRIFIAYSESESDSKGNMQEMVSAHAQAEIKRLNEKYPNFYCAELPPFHTKHVLEVKNGQCVLFNGSFNVLSFEAISRDGKVRREEMALVHHQTAIAKHQEYINIFTEIYLKNVTDDLKNLEPEKIAKYKSDRIDYLHKISLSKEAFVDFYADLEEKQLNAQNTVWLNKYDALLEEIAKAINVGFIGYNEYKQLNNRANTLIRESLSLTISKEVIDTLNSENEKLSKLPRNNNSKENKQDKIKQRSNLSTSDRAKEILKNKNFDSELNTARYVASLNFLYTNKLFNNSNEGSQRLNTLINSSKGLGNLSVFNCVVNKNNVSRANVQIGVAGYSFLLLSILGADSTSKLAEKTKKSRTIRLENVSKNKIEQILLKLLEQ